MIDSSGATAMLHAVQDDSRCRYWRVGPAQRVEASPSDEESKERRGTDRRGDKGIRIFRFSNERRLPQDRRGRVGRSFDRAPVFVHGELRHQGISYRIVTADLSVMGASLLDGPALPIGAMVRLTLRPSDDLSEYPLVLWAQVGSFCAERAMLGVRFVSPRACDSKRLARLVDGTQSSKGESSLAPYRF